MLKHFILNSVAKRSLNDSSALSYQNRFHWWNENIRITHLYQDERSCYQVTL